MTDSPRDPPRHAFEAHTGEILLSVSGSTCEAVFEEAGRALAELMLRELPERPSASEPQRLDVGARDRPALLVAFLNELIFLSETSKQVFPRLQVERVEDTRVRAVAFGVEADALATAVKAATLHDVQVEQREGGWRAQVVLDV